MPPPLLSALVGAGLLLCLLAASVAVAAIRR
jgi:hypothetical protein